MKTNSTFHLAGLIGPGGVHAFDQHIFAILKICHSFGLKKVIVHAILDGRDVEYDSGLKYYLELNKIVEKYHYTIGTISGRYYTMDRDKR